MEKIDLKSLTPTAREVIQATQDAIGFIPNLYVALAESSLALKAYAALSGAFLQESRFTSLEQQVVLMTTSFENNCDYCMAAHSAFCAAQKLDTETISALRDGTPVADPKLESLRTFTRTIVRKQGRVSQDDIGAFERAGYNTAVVLEVIVGVGLKTISNYANHATGTLLDSSFAEFRWEKPSEI